MSREHLKFNVVIIVAVAFVMAHYIETGRWMIAVGVFGAVALNVLLFMEGRDDKRDQMWRTRRDFVSLFSGRCPICSFHRWGVHNSFVPTGADVPPHLCSDPERRCARCCGTPCCCDRESSRG